LLHERKKKNHANEDRDSRTDIEIKGMIGGLILNLREEKMGREKNRPNQKGKKASTKGMAVGQEKFE